MDDPNRTMSEASIDEVLSEEDFQPLARERGERFGRLGHTLLARDQWKWTRRHFYQLIVEADVFEAFLDDHGAGYNRHYRPLRALVASTRGLARADSHANSRKVARGFAHGLARGPPRGFCARRQPVISSWRQ